MWKKLIAGAVIVVVLAVAVAVSYVRAVVGSYHIDLLLDGKVVGSGEFTIRMERFDPSWDLKYQGDFSATGKLEIGKPIKGFILLIANNQAIIGDQITVHDFYIEPSGLVSLQLANSWPDSYFMIQIDDIRGQTSQGKFGHVGFGGGMMEFCQCRVTRK